MDSPRELCPFCSEAYTLPALVHHLRHCENYAEYRTLAGVPEHAARIAELELVNAELDDAKAKLGVVLRDNREKAAYIQAQEAVVDAAREFGVAVKYIPLRSEIRKAARAKFDAAIAVLDAGGQHADL